MPLTQLRRSGRALARKLAVMDLAEPVIVAVPRRGVVVGLEVSRVLHAPLEMVLATRVYRDRASATAVGALALGGVRVTDTAAAAAHGMRPEELDAAFDAAERRLGERSLVESNLAMVDLRDRVAVVVDDAAISGFTMRVALDAVALHRPSRVIAAIALCSDEAAARLTPRVELVAGEQVAAVAAEARHEATARALCPPLSDGDVHAMLRDARGPTPVGPEERPELSAGTRTTSW